MKKFIFSLLLALSLPLAAPLALAQNSYDEGIDYERVVPQLPAAGKGKAEVMELFWYGCPHCYKFEPTLQAWAVDKPDYVDFVHVPAVFNNPAWKIHAQAFYTAEVLGVMDKFHHAMFEAVQEHKRRLNSEDELQGFFADLGVSKEEFSKTFNSFAVQTKVRRAADLTRRSGIDGVPAIIVNGKYRVNGSLAGSYERMITITGDLAAKEAKTEAVAKKPD